MRENTDTRIATALALALLVLEPGCSRKSEPAAKAGRLAGHNVLLITLDTTRADHLGCYGHAAAATPTLDALAQRGTLFRDAYAQVPITLPSHCSLMTGRYPREHGVRNNGQASLGETHDTLASVFQKQGYRTGAFVASFVLDARFGLNRGFETYDDDMGEVTLDTQLLELERPADVVTDRALAWLGTVQDQSFFCWIHYFDPHDPYDPPAQFRGEPANPYDGEIAFVDTQVKRILTWLESARLDSRTIVVVVGDHGESFAEHGERGHTVFLYDTNLHVPLIFAHPQGVPGQKQVSGTVQTLSVFPTVLDLMGWEAPAGLMGRSLLPAFAGQEVDPGESYSESLFVRDAFGWAEQRCLITPQWKYISSARPELFNRRDDPGEKTNIVLAHPAVAKELRVQLTTRYDSMVPGAAHDLGADESSRRALESLGYVSGSSPTDAEDFLTPERLDPKDMLAVVEQFKKARALIRAERWREAVDLLVVAVQRSPSSRELRYTLGTCYLKMERIPEAIAELQAALKIDPESAAALISMGDALVRTQQLEKAIEHYRAAARLSNLDAEVRTKLAMALGIAGRKREALAAFHEALELDPDFPEACYEIGVILADLGRIREAVEYYRRAQRRRQDHADTYYNLGVALLRLGQFSDAAKHLQSAVRLQPDHGAALNNLGISLASQGRVEEAIAAFQKATVIESAAAEAFFNLGVTLAKQSETAKAIASYERAVALEPAHARAVEVLAGIYLAGDRPADAIRVLRVCATQAPDQVRIANSLAWLLATCPHDELRDGESAVVMATRLCRSTRFQHPGLLATLAAACAETGDFEKATETAAEAIQFAEAAGQSQLVESLRGQLESYRAGRPFREGAQR